MEYSVFKEPSPAMPLIGPHSQSDPVIADGVSVVGVRIITVIISGAGA